MLLLQIVVEEDNKNSDNVSPSSVGDAKYLRKVSCGPLKAQNYCNFRQDSHDLFDNYFILTIYLFSVVHKIDLRKELVHCLQKD